MPKYERYTWKGIDKDTSPRALDRGGNRLLAPGSAIDIVNARVISSDEGFDGSVENLKGTTQIANGGLAAGTNTVVGVYEDVQFNEIIYFVHNSSNNHSIWRYKGSDGSFSLIVQNSLLAFTGSMITGIGKDEQVLYWTDNNSIPRKFDISQLPYNGIDNLNLALMAVGPLTAPTVARATNAGLKVNNVAEESFQFCYRFVYKSGELSPLSPYSKIVPADEVPDIFTSSNNIIGVDIAGPSVLEGELAYHIKRIEFLFRVGNTGDWKIFQRIDSFDPLAAVLGVPFTNNEAHEPISDDEVVIGNETIPSKAKCLAFFKDRLFLTANSIGLDAKGDYLTAGFTSQPQTVTLRTGLQFKEGAIHSVGIKFIDEYGRSSLVQPLYTQGIEYVQLLSHTEARATSGQYLPVNLTGKTPPAWAKRYQLVMTRNQFHGVYAQCPANVLYYVRDQVDDTDVAGAGEFLSIDGMIYLDDQPTDFSNSVAQYIHWQIPNNLAIVPTTDMFLTVKSEVELVKKIARIVDVRGDKVVTDNMGVDDWSAVNGHVFIEIFSVRKEKDSIYYETGRDYDCSDGTFNSPGGLILLEGDSHYLDLDGEEKFKYDPIIEDYNYSGIVYNASMIKQDSAAKVISPSPTVSNSTDSSISIAFIKDKKTKSILDRYVKKYDASVVSEFKKNITYTIDYNRIANNFGRAFVEQIGDGVFKQANRLMISDPRIQDSNINGLSTFDSKNSYPIPNELSPIVHLTPIGNNVMLAIHERETTSLTIGEGFLKEGLDGQTIAKTVGVVGDDRGLLGSYGTIHPESVQIIEGLGFFYDVHKGAIVRYASNGLYPVSDYGMKAYFFKKSQSYIPNKNNIKVVSGIDRYHNEYIISFPADGGESAETWAFNYVENKWVARYEYYPELFGRLNNELFSFLAGELWKHNISATYNHFHGNQRERSLKFHVNPEVTKSKRLLNIHIHADQLAITEDDSNTKQVFKVTTADGQSSFIEVREFVKEHKEGVYYGQVLRDVNSPNIPAGKLALRDGDEIRSQYFTVELICDVADSHARLHSATLVWTDSEYSR